jgi:GNAT superfamily N-acetyltransferase
MHNLEQHLRPATAQDLPGLVALINEAYRVESFCLAGDRVQDQDVRDFLEEGLFLVLGTAVPGGPLQGSVYLKVAGTRAYLGLLAVAPNLQGAGLARRLMEGAEAHCRAAGCSFLDLTVVNLRGELLSFYAKFGFAPYGSVPFPRPAKMLRPCHLIQFTKPLVPVASL